MTHLDATGRPRMVEVGGKSDTLREAVAKGEVVMRPETLALIRDQGRYGDAATGGRSDGGTQRRGDAPHSALGEPLRKGDVLAVAQVAGIMAAKQTSQLIPLCHPIAITGVDLGFELDEARSRVLITASVRTVGKTGVEMEALTAVAVAGLTVYDMCKAVDRGMRLEHVRLVRKSGGRSGTYEVD